MNNLPKFTNKQYIIGGLLVLTLLGLPLITFMSQRSQETRSRASASTTLAITPDSTTTAPILKNAGDPVVLDVFIDPGNNLPSIVKLDITYDATKFQPNAVPFVVNTQAFPSKLEGPIVTNGHILLSLSIGSDATKAIQTRTKVGTIQLTALSATTEPAVIGFGTRSQVLSVASSDESNQNVLSTSTPAYIAITAPATPTPSPYQATVSATPTQTASVSPTEYPVGGGPTYAPTAVPTIEPTYPPTSGATLTPTAAQYPSITTAPNDTILSFNLLIHGIGSSGDNVNPTSSSMSNKNPLHPQRTIEVQVFDSTNMLVRTVTGPVTYSSASGSFLGKVSLGSSFIQGIYTVKVKEPTHLRRLVPGIITIKPLMENAISQIALVAGDINNDNFINVVDYNILVGCYSDLLPPVSCTDITKQTSDLNDDGAVNQIDYNLFLREITVQLGG